MVFSLSCLLSSIYQIETLVPETLLILLGKLGVNLTLGVGQLVVLLTFIGSIECIDECSVHTLEVDGLLFLTHLLVNLILCLNSAFSIILRHSQINQFVVSLSLLSVISQRSKVLLQQLISIVVGLCFHNGLQTIAVTGKCGSTGYHHHCHHHYFLHNNFHYWFNVFIHCYSLNSQSFLYSRHFRAVPR